MFKNHFLHGHGKRVNPNSIIEYGIFKFGEFIEDSEEIKFIEKTKFQLPKKVDWEYYFSNEQHISLMKEVISSEQ